MNFGDRLKNCCHIHWQGFFYLVSPVVLLPLVFLEPVLQWRTIFLMLWSLIWYVVEPAPLAATGIITMIFVPLLGIMSSNQICMCFARDSNILVLLCNFVAVAMQHCNIVKRQAFFILSKMSCDPRRILVIVMVLSYILTAVLPAAFVCAIVMPTIRATLQYLDEISICKPIDEELEPKHDEDRFPSKVAIAFYTGAAYAINIGSITMALSSDSGLALRALILNEPDLSQLEDLFYWKYLLFALPVSLLLLLVAIGCLEVIFLGLKRPQSKAAQQLVFDREASKAALKVIESDLPPFNAHMFWVALLFFCSMVGVIVCSVINPEVNDKALKYSFNAMLLCFLYFVLPRNFDFCNYFRFSAPKEFKTAPSVLPWGPVNKLTPWSTFFVYGSSVAFGFAIKHTDLHLFVGAGLLNAKNRMVQQVGLIGLAMLFTVIASNNFVAEVMLGMGLNAEAGSSHPAALLFPTTWACCLTFLLPVSSAANTFAMGWGNVRAKDMMLAGIGPTVFGFLIIFLMGIIIAAIP